MFRQKSSCFTNELLDNMRCRRDNEAKSMLNKNLAKATDGLGTLLHYASFYGNETIVRHLIKLGSEIDPLQRDSGETPLMIAVKHGRTAIVKVLLDADANINAVDAGGKTVLQMVFGPQYFNAQIVEAFLRRMRSETRTEELVGSLLNTACTLIHVAYLRDIEVMNCMLNRGFDILSRGPRQLSALHVAAEVNDLKLAKWLTDRGADVDAIDEDGKSPLLIAALHGGTEMVQLLLDQGADPKVTDFRFR